MPVCYRCGSVLINSECPKGCPARRAITGYNPRETARAIATIRTETVPAEGVDVDVLLTVLKELRLKASQEEMKYHEQQIDKLSAGDRKGSWIACGRKEASQQWNLRISKLIKELTKDA